MYKSLVINPGSTSTEIAVFADDKEKWQSALEHHKEDLDNFTTITDQLDWRQDLILREIKEADYSLTNFDFIVARGGLLAPIPGGTYRIDENMIDDLQQCRYGEHASNLAGIIAFRFAQEAGIPAYTVDPVAVDEFIPVARLSGHVELPRRCQSHALNLKGIARRCAEQIGGDINSLNLIGAHLGGGISVAPLRQGRIIDVNNANQGGPFSPERAGTLPALDLVEYIFAKTPDKNELKKDLVGSGGLTAYLDTADAREVEELIASGHEMAEEVYEAMIYQIAKEIGRMAAVLKGRVDAIFLTGGLAHSEYLTSRVKNRVDFIAPVYIFPGSEELISLVRGGLRVMQGREEPKDYEMSRLDTSSPPVN